VGVILSVAALVILVVLASMRGDAWRVVSFSIYGAALINLYAASTLYHSLKAGSVKNFFEILDHSSIYLLIAGTYTPVTLISMRGPWGWTLFGLVWVLAIGGMILQIGLGEKFKKASVVLYVVMGWMAVIALKPMLEMIPVGLLIWILVGGLFYTLGLIFYGWKKMRYQHSIWHLFVLGGSASHFFGILLYLT